MGAITDRVKAYVPATYSAMVTNGDPALFSESDLQALADFVKFRLLGSTVLPADEATAFNSIIVTFLSKLTTLQFIPAAIDYWDSRLASEVVPGEVQQFRDHVAGLQALHKMLSDEVTQDWKLIGPGLGYGAARRSKPAISYGDGGRGLLKTPDPFDIPSFLDCSPPWLTRLPWRVV